MSTTSAPNQEFENVRKRVLQIAKDIEKLSKSDVPPKKFFPKFLEMLVQALGAQAGAVWQFSEDGQLSLNTEVNLADTGMRDNPEAAQKNNKILSEVIQTGESVAYAPDEGKADDLPTNHLIVLSPLQVDSDSVGAIQIFQRPDAPQQARAGYLQFVEQMCGYASRYMKLRKQGPETSSQQEFWEQFEQFALRLQRAKDMKEFAATAASDGRLLLGSDRLSVAYKRGNKVTIKAISGQDSVNPRANLVRNMVEVSQEVIKLGEPLIFTGKIQSLAQQMEKPLANYVQESGSRMVMFFPLKETEPLLKPDDESIKEKKNKKRQETIGCLVVEQTSDSDPRPYLKERAEVVADHVAAGLFKAREIERISFLGLWKLLGKTLEWFHGRKLAKTLAILGAVLAVVLSLVFIPADYRVQADGRLMPIIQQDVFAPMNGKVVNIFRENFRDKNDDPIRVKEGTPLILLENDELKSQYEEVSGDLDVKEQQVISLRSSLEEANEQGNTQEARKMEGQIEETRTEITGLKAQIKLLEQRKAQLVIRAPIDGLVVTFQYEKNLLGRPIQRGEILLSILDPDAEWHLELEVSEKRMGHLLIAQKNIKKDLEIEFILGTSVENKYSGVVHRIATRPVQAGEEGSVVEVIGSTDRSKIPNLRIGSEVKAKIYCGKKAIGYVWFGDVIETVQRFWFSFL